MNEKTPGLWMPWVADTSEKVSVKGKWVFLIGPVQIKI